MKKVNKILKQLSGLYEFNRKIKDCKLKDDEVNRKRLEKKDKNYNSK